MASLSMDEEPASDKNVFPSYPSAEPSLAPSAPINSLKDDNVVHFPLGAGSYLYQSGATLAKSLFHSLGLRGPIVLSEDRTLIVHVGAQPNNSPHVGTLVTFSTAAHLARLLEVESSQYVSGQLTVQISLDLVDTAPDDSKREIIDQIVYQQSHRATGAHKGFVPDYEEISRILAQRLKSMNSSVQWRLTKQVDLMSHPYVPVVLEAIIARRADIGPYVSPDSEVLALRSPCPKPGCGRADKHASRTEYTQKPLVASRFQRLSTLEFDTTIHFHCPIHGQYDLSLSNPADVCRIEMNTPLRNLVRTYAYGLETLDLGDTFHIRVTGSDYAGQYQEQTCFAPMRALEVTEYNGALHTLPSVRPPVFFYSPLVLDWSGAKLSKSLYLKSGAYGYLKELKCDWLLAFSNMKKHKVHPLTIIFDDVGRWMESPKKMYRSISIEYLVRMVQEGSNPPLDGDDSPPLSHLLTGSSNIHASLDS